ncbi:MAG TPA: DUF805 domain-containing protein [Novosphingobium sp.]|nr:DUF805 domain-containing protein [Novosphingobium sp.]
MEWMILPLKRYADFSGRSQRMEYWLYQLMWVLVMGVCLIVMFAGLPWTEMEKPDADPGPLFWVGVALAVLWYLVTFIPDIAVTVRRFHDQDQSGWMYLLKFIPYLGWIVIFVFMCLEGTKGPNRFGTDPTDPTSAEVFA